MIPRVAKSGRSFKGAALYYLHDKKANTSDRVAFVETLNLPTNDAQRAVAHMIDTAAHAIELKQAAGIRGGRKSEKPVYAYSLAWHPSEAPTQAEQVAAARETIAALGMSDRQALIVSHNDTDHPHVHIIINRICPETGRSAVPSNDQIILSEWALKYQQERGQTFTPEREKNQAKRQHGEWVKHRPEQPQTAYAWKKETSDKLWSDYRAERDAAKDSRKPMLDALWQQRENRMAARKAEVAAFWKPRWRDLFKDQKRERTQFDGLMLKRLHYALKQSRINKVKATFLSIFSANTMLRIQFERDQKAARTLLGQQHKQAIKDTAREVTKAWKYDRAELSDMWKKEDDKRLARAKEQSDTVWQRDKSGEHNQKPAHVKKSFADRVREQTPANELDDAKEQARKRSRKRPRGKGRTLDID